MIENIKSDNYYAEAKVAMTLLLITTNLQQELHVKRDDLLNLTETQMQYFSDMKDYIAYDFAEKLKRTNRFFIKKSTFYKKIYEYLEYKKQFAVERGLWEDINNNQEMENDYE